MNENRTAPGVHGSSVGIFVAWASFPWPVHMTRRIAIAILFTVWTMLIVGGLIAYFTTRSILLANLDDTLANSALTHASQERDATAEPPLHILRGDRYVTQNDLKQTVARPSTYPAGLEPRVIFARFSGSPEQRLRTVTVKYFAVSIGSESAPRSLTTTISRSAMEFDALMNRLSLTLTVFGMVAGLLAAGVAVRVSQSALRPLATTAQQVGTIDEQHLDRRIDATRLPPELIPMADRLNEMLSRLQDAFALRNRFLADASHELRTPVASLVTTLDVALARPREADAYRRTLETCRGDARQLRHLVEQLMEQVRSQSPSHPEPPQTIDISALLRECADNVAPLADVKQVAIVHRFADELSHAVPPGGFRSIVINLLGNAIEYNRPRGTVEISCSCNGHGLELSVRDTGIGIAPEHLPHVFEPFYRADKARRHEAGHLGLGLSLVYSHVKTMSGTCEVESQPGEGTTFRVLLPPCNGAANATSIAK